MNNQPSRQLQDTFIPQSIIDRMAIEKWINEILKVSGGNGKYTNLRQLGLDRNSLKSAGLKDEDVNRIYRSMFVYTVGFYEMLKDILKNYELTAMIWQVFGILLEYVAKGDFQFTINQIYKEGQQKIEELNERLMQREQKFMSIEIQAQDEINHLQNLIQDLNNQYNLLKQQKENVELDFQQSNIAFEDAVTLKILFQSKIIEIASIYREQAQNYSQLSEELNELKILYDKNNDDLIMSKKQVESMMAEINMRDNSITHLNQTIENQLRLLDEKQKKIQTLELNITQLRKDYVFNKNTYIDYEYQFNLLNMQFSKYKEENIQKLQEFQIFQITYGDTLELNKKLANENQVIRQETSKLQNENKYLKIVTDELENLEQGYKSSILQLQQDTRNLIEEYEDKIKKFQITQVEYQFGIQRIQVQQDEILAFNQNLQQMKINKNHLNEIIFQNQAQIQQLQSGLEEKEQTIQELEKSQSKLKQDEISYQKQIEQLRNTINSQNFVIIEEREEFEKLKNQFQSQLLELRKVKSLYNDQVLENHHLVKRQKYTDNAINDEKNKIIELVNEITFIRAKHADFLQVYKALEIKFDEFKIQMNKDIQLQKDQYTDSLNYYKNMQKEMVHKMILEDALSLIDRTNQQPINLNQSQKHVEEQRNLLKNKNLELHKEIDELNTNLKQQINLIQKLQSDQNNTSNRLKIVKFKQLVYFVSLKEVTEELKLKTDSLIQIQNSNEDLKIELKRLKEETINQKQLISRQIISSQGQFEQIEDQASTNDFQDFRSTKLQINQDSSNDCQGYFNSQIMQQNEIKNSQNQMEKKVKRFSQKQEQQKFKLKQLFKTVNLLEQQGDNQSQSRNLQDFQIQDSFRDILSHNLAALAQVKQMKVKGITNPKEKWILRQETKIIL
ncbi:unnamed protein product (macronuclear) [Paramecium tetraurelia]|uniref:Uncharacterized protein n=1 Tax=Paramecium tetraurelia TaxID=5888 RepID=A0DPL4_PARTE|nr:uncharacterized protein GSPATT00019163001 [Paramecium tetraurelia]CAK84981.1 unnamed protein product [Paramecium tetraurelia]|eukprot:XP_001452378.1 hypothetical protein (macronuclear) [Paramecium tetraurelia strain d4-2]